jgi:hypothetical protein
MFFPPVKFRSMYIAVALLCGPWRTYTCARAIVARQEPGVVIQYMSITRQMLLVLLSRACQLSRARAPLAALAARTAAGPAAHVHGGGREATAARRAPRPNNRCRRPLAQVDSGLAHVDSGRVGRQQPGRVGARVERGVALGTIRQGRTPKQRQRGK